MKTKIKLVVIILITCYGVVFTVSRLHRYPLVQAVNINGQQYQAGDKLNFVGRHEFGFNRLTSSDIIAADIDGKEMNGEYIYSSTDFQVKDGVVVCEDQCELYDYKFDIPDGTIKAGQYLYTDKQLYPITDNNVKGIFINDDYSF